jgi:ABC-type transport system involved in cytochrome c biogenesis permease subunit
MHRGDEPFGTGRVLTENPWFRFSSAFAFVLVLEGTGFYGLHRWGGALPWLSLALLVMMAALAGALNAIVPLRFRESKESMLVGMVVVMAILAIAFFTALLP